MEKANCWSVYILRSCGILLSLSDAVSWAVLSESAPLSPLSHSLQPGARFAPLFLLFSPSSTFLSTIFHTFIRTALHSFLLCPCPLRLWWPGDGNMEGMKGREMGGGGVRSSQNRDGVSSPPWVWISICAVGWQLQTSLSADGFDQRCQSSIVANEGTGACELPCPSLLTWLSVAAPIRRWLPWQLIAFPSSNLRQTNPLFFFFFFYWTKNLRKFFWGWLS